MPVLFACPHCGEQTLVDEQFAGESGPCINCGKTIVVPQFVPPEVAAASADIQIDEQAQQRTRKLLTILGSVAAAAVVIIVLTLIGIPVFHMARASGNRRVCANNLRQIGAALAAYENRWNSLPPAIVYDANGQPMHSWRVLILPYLGPEGQQLAQQYRMDEPWNSPNNRRVAQQMPKVFRSPGDMEAKPDETSYVVIVGPTTAFPSQGSLHRTTFSDAPTQTILVMEIYKTGIGWTEPRDPTHLSLMFQIGADVGGSHEGGMNVLMADGQVRFLPDSLDAERVGAMATANGRELIDEWE